MKNVRQLVFSVAALYFAAALYAGELRIIFTSDLHGRLRNYAVLATAIRENSTPDTIVIDAGDTVSGVFAAEYAENGTGMAEALNLARVELWVPGNHDFELPAESFRDFVRRFRGTALGGDWNKGGISGVPFVLIDRGGVRCAVIGLTDPKMPRRILPGTGMEFHGAYNTLRRVMPRVRALHPDAVVLVWHSGRYSASGFIGTFLKEFPGIDVVVGAHSHEENPGQRIGGNTLFVQAGAHGHAAGVIDIRTDRNDGRIIDIRSRLIRGNPLRPDRELLALHRRLESSCAGMEQRFLGRFSPPLRQPRIGESDSRFGRLCAEALRRSTAADAAIIWIGCGDFRARSDFTYGQLFRMLPYRNEICTLEVTRSELEALIAGEEHRTRKWRRRLFVSGIKLRRSKHGGTVLAEAPERLLLAVSDYVISESRVLRPLIGQPGRRWSRTGILERDAVADFMKKSGKTGHTVVHLQP